ncbi:Hypothetical protein DEACI_2483 [Acididesulfobacillus acetoxydans]|uniref:Uncharacterized protein n=1 Tax=Acididesulfobacillus acetoxydans TaxID=1561005 RepID=A0A8S0WPB7_9FIRM|nr:hypothetical protein [Acididesulfobacillus acetoxydans]CAA7601814.1 Hypothetical protein DEACI_2483 [Acididesulfobacillus acetoxydans]CEJ09330.1 Hypothetical protein DEACI_3814 [Acididesulfobacillus acetoxydans]
MKALFTLTSSESKRLIAKGVKALPAVKKALAEHTIIIAGGTTNAFVAEELLNRKVPDKTGYTVGIVTEGKTGLSSAPDPTHPFVVQKGRPLAIHWKEYLPNMQAGDVFIKGGNALDHTGLAAVMVSDSAGGTIGLAQGILLARGIPLIVPIGLEKMVPDVRTALEFLTPLPDEALGQKVGLIPMLGATVVTELTALGLLYGLEARAIAAGGVGGSEGAVTIAVEGPENEVRRALGDIKSFKGEPPVRYLS